MLLTLLTGIAWGSSALFCVQLLFLLIGVDSHSHATSVHDLHGDHSADTSFKMFSFQSAVAFLMGFGWLGMAALEDWSLDESSALIVASLFGAVIMGIYLAIMFAVNKLNSTHTPNYSECIGKTGIVYMSIPMHGPGQIEISFGGKVSILDAINIADNGIYIGSSVLVVGIREKTLVFKEL